MAEITVPLSRKGIADAKKFLLDYKKNVLQKKLKLFVERLAQIGVETAKANITTFDAIFTGELLNSIHEESGVQTKNAAIFYVVADSEHAAFVEFGTGQIGMEGSYPYPFPEGVEWNYNTGKTIFEISPGQYGWFYPMGDGTWRFTQGMPSRPFMYETAIDLRQRIVQIAKEVFK